MGELLNQIQAARIGSGRKSDLEVILEKLSPEDGADLKAALDDSAIPAAAIARALNARGLKVSSAVINRYRRGESDYGLR